MKNTSDMIQKVYTVFAIFVTLLLAETARAQTTNANEFWVSTNAATANLGTISDPYDGSTSTKFDSLMNNLPANSTIHIMAGTYRTLGAYGWRIKTGQKVHGSGKDVTILQFPSSSLNGWSLVGSPDGQLVTNTEVCDLTCDANYTSGEAKSYCGVMLTGNGNAVRRVKIINLAGLGGWESWGVGISGFGNDSKGNIIEECEVSHFAGGPCSAIEISAASGIVRNNRVFLSATNNVCQAFNGSWAHDVLYEGNYVDGAANGYYGDTGGSTNLIFIGNTFLNCINGIGLNAESRRNITIAFNTIMLANQLPGAYAAFNFWNCSMTNLVIIGNNVGVSNPGANGNCVIDANNTTGFVFANNMVDSGLAANQTNNSYYYNNINVSMYNNYDLFGNYLTGLNMPMIGNTPVTAFGLSLVGSASASPALTALGLPSNPTAVVTNGSTQPVVFNTNMTVNGNVVATQFTGDGSSLTGITATQVGAAAASQMPQKFTSTEYALTNAQYSISTSHGLSGPPQFVRWVLVCKTNELGYVVGDEVSAGALVNSTDNSRHPLEMASSTAVAFVFSVNGAAMQLPNKTNPVAPASLTSVSSVIKNWKLKCYATYLP